MLRLDRYVHGSVERDDVTIRLDWINPDGNRRNEEDWNFGHAFGALYETAGSDAVTESVAVLFNAWEGELEFVLPEPAAGSGWQLEFLSAQESREIRDRRISLPGRSIALVASSSR